MKTNQHTQDIMIVLQAILSMHRMSFHKNDILNIYTFNMNPILTYDKHMFIATLLTFNNILCCIRKMLDKCHLQTTDFIRQNKIGKTYNFKNFRFLINSLRTLMLTTLTGRTKTYSLYVNLYVFCTVLIREHYRLQLQFIVILTFISYCWMGFQPRLIRMLTVLVGFSTTMNAINAFGFELD